MLLAAITQGLSASLDLDTVLQRVVTGAQELCGSERAFLSLRVPGTEALVGRYEVGAPRAGYAGLRLAPGQGLGGRCSAPDSPGARRTIARMRASAKCRWWGSAWRGTSPCSRCRS